MRWPFRSFAANQQAGQELPLRQQHSKQQHGSSRNHGLQNNGCAMLDAAAAAGQSGSDATISGGSSLDSRDGAVPLPAVPPSTHGFLAHLQQGHPAVKQQPLNHYLPGISHQPQVSQPVRQQVGSPQAHHLSSLAHALLQPASPAPAPPSPRTALMQQLAAAQGLAPGMLAQLAAALQQQQEQQQEQQQQNALVQMLQGLTQHVPTSALTQLARLAAGGHMPAAAAAAAPEPAAQLLQLLQGQVGAAAVRAPAAPTSQASAAGTVDVLHQLLALTQAPAPQPAEAPATQPHDQQSMLLEMLEQLAAGKPPSPTALQQMPVSEAVQVQRVEHEAQPPCVLPASPPAAGSQQPSPQRECAEGGEAAMVSQVLAALMGFVGSGDAFAGTFDKEKPLSPGELA